MIKKICREYPFVPFFVAAFLSSTICWILVSLPDSWYAYMQIPRVGAVPFSHMPIMSSIIMIIGILIFAVCPTSIFIGFWVLFFWSVDHDI